MQNVLVIRSVYGKVGNTYFIQPCPNPKTGRYPDVVKRVDSKGDMILTEAERNSGKYYIPETETFAIVDGTTFDLDDEIDAAKWKAIEYCTWIAKDRFERNDAGELVIDGNAKRYGVADLYVERPGEISKKTVSKKKLVGRAYTYIFDDTDINKRRKAKVLGRDMEIAPISDVEEFLTQYAERDPKKIIDLYEGEDWKLHLFILDACDKGVIRKRDNIYSYNDKPLGGSIESTILFMRDVSNRTIVNNIKKETYPQLLPKSELDALNNENIIDNTPFSNSITSKDKGKGNK